MKMNVYVILLVLSLTGGCSSGFGFVPMNLEPVKATLEYWEKPGMTSESRLVESAQCGGGYTLHTGFRPETIRAAQREGETERDTDFRLFHDWQRCMLKKGYRSTQQCYDNEISRAMPSCGAP
ncbi:hypothetical protein NHH88_20105 [Oxalobacteraceae bacterium OTU3CAMAD1]|jgi:hypothetical protein|nr:hypothetical protein NHH88_20105 [Oxalobacteraceae bacterium OTU3CAMAD1]